MNNEITEYSNIPITKLRESTTNPRRRFDENSLNELADSVRVHGVLEPILVRTLDGRWDGWYEIIAGARRYRASKKAELEEVPVRIIELTDEQALEVQVIENLQREDVHPLDEAAGYRALIEKTNQGVEAIAGKVGKSVSYVYQRLKLTDLSEAVQKAFLEDKVTAGHAILIARLQPDDQVEALEYCVDKWDSPSVRDLRDWIEQEIHRELKSAPFSPKNAKLLPEVGDCIQCPKRTGFAPALFPDLEKKDACTDRDCWTRKIEAHIDSVRAKHAGSPLLEISTDYKPHAKKQGLIGRQKWEHIEGKSERCTSTQKALVIEGGYANMKLGSVIEVCADPKCKKHHAWRSGSAAGTAKTPQQLAADRKVEANAIARKRAIGEIADGFDHLLGPADLLLVISALADELWTEKVKVIATRRGWRPKEKPKHGGVNWLEVVQENAAGMSDFEMCGLLMEMAMYSQALEIVQWPKKVDRLKPIAERYRVDLQALQKTALNELKAKDQAKKKKTAKKKASKKKVAKRSPAKKVQTSAKSKAA